MQEWYYEDEKGSKVWSMHRCKTSITVEGNEYPVLLQVAPDDFPHAKPGRAVRIVLFGDEHHLSELRQIVMGMSDLMQIGHGCMFVSDTIPEGGTISLIAHGRDILATWQLIGDRLERQ
jgi:hypothetical protein